MTILFTGTVRFSDRTKNPWLSVNWARRTRRHLSACTLDSLIHGELAFTAGALASAGFDAISLANPSLLAEGPAALQATLDALHSRRLDTIGAGFGDEAYQPHIISKAGLTVGLVAAAHMPDSGGFASDNQVGIADLRDPRILAAADLARARGARCVYLMINAGSSWLPRIPKGIDYAQFLVPFDGIVVTGPRVPARVRQGSTGFVVSPGTFHDASATRSRWATVAWAEGGHSKLSPISQTASPPLTRSGSRLPMRLLGGGQR